MGIALIINFSIEFASIYANYERKILVSMKLLKNDNNGGNFFFFLN